MRGDFYTLVSFNRDCIVFSFVLCLCVLGYGSWRAFEIFDETPSHFQAHSQQMMLNGSKFWDMKEDYYGFSRSKLSNNTLICDCFFALWPSDCVDKNDDLHEKLRVISAQMEVMDSTLTLYVTAMTQCSFPYPRISVELFNSTELLTEMGFDRAFEKINTWIKTRYTRYSDILRLGLAFKFGKAYMDTDIAYLQLRKELYLQPYVGAAVWSNSKNAIEISNAAFCLPRNILKDMIAFQKTRILRGDGKYFYTELGPSMFHNVLMNRHDVILYSQNAPIESNLNAIARGVHKYGHKQLHLTGHVRKGNPAMSYGRLVNAIRSKCGFPKLTYTPRAKSV